MARPNKPKTSYARSCFGCGLPLPKITDRPKRKSRRVNPERLLRGLGVGAKPERIVPTRDREALLKTLAEQNKIGSNLNQIARVLNNLKEDRDMRGISADHVHEVLYGIDLFKKLLMEQLK